MKIVRSYTYFHGAEFLAVHQPQVLSEIEAAVSSIELAQHTSSDAKPSYSAAKVIGAFRAYFDEAGWTVFQQNDRMDYVKYRVAVEPHFETHASKIPKLFFRQYALYRNGETDVGIIILPMEALSSRLHSECMTFETVVAKLTPRGLGVPAVPLVILGVGE